MAAREDAWTRRRALWPITFVLVWGILTALRLYGLDAAPADIYGDISDIFDYLKAILELHWPVRFNYSAGPLYHYLIVPIFVLFGRDYLAIKIASVLVSLLVLASTWLLAREVSSNRTVALLAVWLAGVSSWLLIFSRLGNSQILTPLLACLVFVFLARYRKKLSGYPLGPVSDRAPGRAGNGSVGDGTVGHRPAQGFRADMKQRGLRDLLLATVFAGLGLYSYPQTFFLLPALAAPLLWWFLRGRCPLRHLLSAGLMAFMIAIPFLLMLLQPGVFDQEYIGTKLEGLGWQAQLRNLGRNTVASLLMLHVRGDRVFRSNPHQLPHLDPVTGVLLLVGIWSLLRSRERDALWYTVWPLLFLQLPSILVLTRPQEVPSASRSLLIVPFAAVLAALGLAWLVRHIRAPVLAASTLIVVCAAVGWLNYHRYFNDYVHGLPNQNYSFARAIAEKIDTAPRDASVWVFGAYWGQKRTPERRAIQHALVVPRTLHFKNKDRFDCSVVAASETPHLLILDPHAADLEHKARKCFPDAEVMKETMPDGTPVYVAVEDYR